LLPPGTVHLATSFNSIQWLDRLPNVPLPHSIGYRRPLPALHGPAASPEATAAFSHQAEQDLLRFLECRAQELVPGGKLLLASPGDSDEGRVGDGLIDVLNDACLDLVAEGRLEQGQYERVTLPVYCRTVEELRSPLERGDSSVRSAFVVERARSLEVPTPFRDQLRRSGDVAAYAADYTGFLRAISEPVIQAAFDPAQRRAAIVDRLYERVRDRLLAEPDRYSFRYILVAMLLTRR
jgi:hypothetical protein